VPTPFYHLDLAENLLVHPGLPHNVRRHLLANRAAFLLGNTAPDVQVISGQARERTHFFRVPPRSETGMPWEEVLLRYPQYQGKYINIPGQAAFWAGYLCHLQADWIWVAELFLPYFGPDSTWGFERERLYLHNVLRAYLDRQISAQLPVDEGAQLASVSPGGWLPFVPGSALEAWRDYLVSQLLPGAKIQTVEVFASRAGLPAAEFYALLDDETEMDRKVFNRLPRRLLGEYRDHLLHENCNLLVSYLGAIGEWEHESY
jgi:hypothetical protein